MSTVERKSWTARVRERAVQALPPEKLLPDSQPSYMASWIYVFGVLSLASLVLIIASGSILSLKGPGWWHFTGIGHFFNRGPKSPGYAAGRTQPTMAMYCAVAAAITRAWKIS